MARSVWTLAAFGVVLASTSCGGARPVWSPVPEPDEGDVVWSLFLIGDAGAPQDDDPVLKVLTEQAGRRPDSSTIVFLGDNIYPAGLPGPEAIGRETAEQLLDRQVEVFRKSKARGFFIPGNHDWAEHGPDGLQAIRRQGEFIQSRAEGLVELLPANGCPGPEVRDAGPFRLVMIDTHWWLHGWEKPEGAESPCAVKSSEAVVESIALALADTVRTRPVALDSLASGSGLTDSIAVVVDTTPFRTLILGHHPLSTGGIHGGSYPVGDYLFPLRNIRRWLWLPVPVIGSLYPLVRGAGVSPQDMANPLNRAMRQALQQSMTGNAPLAYVAGHEHNLQVLEGDVASWYLVSGAGYYGHVSHVSWLPTTRFAAEASGFMRLDALASGKFRLAVIAVEFDGKSREIFSLLLE